MSGLFFEELEYKDDKTGNTIVRIIPKFIPPPPLASGEITFAYFEYWKDGDQREKSILNAMNNAKSVIESWIKNVHS